MLSFATIPYREVNTEDRLHLQHWHLIERRKILKKADRHIQRLIFSVFGILCGIYVLFSIDNDLYKAGQIVKDILPLVVGVPAIVIFLIGIYVAIILTTKDKEMKYLLNKSSLKVSEVIYRYLGDYLIDINNEDNKIQTYNDNKKVIWSDEEEDKQYRIYRANYKDSYKYFVVKRGFED